jgi:cellulose synthase/poly-beta-1,6-N-acetylglucosamine synthase-like glycosyltransferase
MTFSTGLELVLGVLVAYYVLVLVGLSVGLQHIKHHPSTAKPLVSVIVAARNEESTIGRVLECLAHQDYPSYEIILVNDRSSDNTSSIAEEFQLSCPALQRIDITSASTQMPSKKYALAQGIASSKGEILCFTDADCSPPPAWISSLVAAFDERVGLVAGYSPYILPKSTSEKTRTLFSRLCHRFIEYEEFKGATWAAGSIGLRRGWLCTGRSLAYRRRLYDEVGGFEKIKQSISGDDDLFLQLVRRTTRWQIRYVTAAESYVPTLAPLTLHDFLHQRVRHFSAGKYFPPSMKAFFIFFHLTNIVILLSFIGSIVFGSDRLPYWPYLVKLGADSLLFLRAARVFGETRFAPWFIFLDAIYVIYNSLVGPLGLLYRFEWKTEKA